MAKKQIETLIDDLDKTTEAIDTVEFGYAKKWYEIDVNRPHLDEFYAFVARFVKAGRVINRPKPTVDVDHRKVIAFCEARDIPGSKDGRLSKSQILAYVTAWADGSLEARFR